MKKLLVAILFLTVAISAIGQTKQVKIIFDVSSKDTLAHKGAIRHASMMAEAYPESSFMVVVYGSALPMMVKGKSTVEKDLVSLTKNKNVSLKACGVTMQRQNVDKSQLITGVEVSPNAIMEIVTKQGEGWGYIKEGN